MPSPIAWNFSARQRAAPEAGNSAGASPMLSSTSQITGLSYSDEPSSVTRHGTFEVGLSARRSAGEACGLDECNWIRPSSPRVIAHAMTLRTYGLVAE